MTIDALPCTLDELRSVLADLVQESEGRILARISGIAGDLGDAASYARSGALRTSLRVKAQPGVLYGLSGWNDGAATRHVQLFDSDDRSPPAEGVSDMIDVIAGVAAGASYSRDYGKRGMRFERGLWVVSSSTVASKTISAADDLLIFARYR